MTNKVLEGVLKIQKRFYNRETIPLLKNSPCWQRSLNYDKGK